MAVIIRPRPPKEKSKGFWGSIKAIPGDFLEGAAKAAYGAPTGLFHMGRTLASDIAAEPWSLLMGPAAPLWAIGAREIGPGRSHFVHQTAIPMGYGLKATAQHPLRDPFQTALLGAAVLNPAIGAGLRGSAALSAARFATRAGRTGRVVDTAITYDPANFRFLKSGRPARNLREEYRFMRNAPEGAIDEYFRSGPSVVGAGGNLVLRDLQGLGAGVRAGARAFVKKPVYTSVVAGERVPGRFLEIKTPTGTSITEAQAFRSPIGIASQKLMDAARARFPESRVFSPFQGSLLGKIGHERRINTRIKQAIAESPAELLRALGGKLNNGQQMAVWVEAVGWKTRAGGQKLSVNDHIAFHRRMIEEGVGSKRGHNKWIGWLEESKQYLNDTPMGPRIKADLPALRDVATRYRKASGQREELWQELGVLTPEELAARRAAPGQQMKYGGPLPDEPGGQLALFQEQLRIPEELAPDYVRLYRGKDPKTGDAPETFTLRKPKDAEVYIEIPKAQAADLVKDEGTYAVPASMVAEHARPIRDLGKGPDYIPSEPLARPFEGGVYAPELGARQARRVRQKGGFVARRRKEHIPGSLTHEYEATLLRSGKGRPKFTNFMAESLVEAERFAALLRARGELQSHVRHATDRASLEAIAADKNMVPINLGPLSEADVTMQGIFEKLASGAKLNAQETRTLGMTYEFFRQNMFPQRQPALSLASRGELPAGWGWIDKRELGGLERINPIITRGAGVQKAVNIVDAINDASRLAFIYLKFGYIPSNLLGNIAMNIVQQGFATPRNLAWAARVDHKLGTRRGALVDRIMGLGITSLARGETWIGHEASTRVAGVMSNIIDKIPRRAAWYHEARKAGYKTDDDIYRLLTDATKQDDLVRITRQAREAIGDYERLGPIEKGIIRRIVFFYPWLKVSTRMTGRTLIEYPYKSAAIGQLSDIGRQQQLAAFGLEQMPPGFEQLVPVGGGNVFDPRSVAIWSTPAEIALTARSLFQKDSPWAYNISQWGTPLWGAALAGMARQTGFGTPSSESQARIFWNELGPQIPLWQLQKKLQRSGFERGQRLYPQSNLDVWLQFLTSGWRGPVNPFLLNERNYPSR